MPNEISCNQIAINDEARWNQLLYNSFQASYRASMVYEYAKKHIGRETVSFIFQQNGHDIAGAHYSIKRGSAGLIKTADILSGIVFKGFPTEELITFILNHFTTWAMGKKVSYIRYNPWIPSIVGGAEPNYKVLFESSLKSLGFSALTKSINTYWIDLKLSEEQLLMNMKSSTRSKVKRAVNSDIKVHVEENPIRETIDTFWELYNNLGKRKEFRLLSETRFKEEVYSLLNSKQALLFVMNYKGVVVNIALASRFGYSMYFHGALNPDYTKLEGCPSPGHLAQWEIIKYMKSLGLEVYDMAFCPGDIPDKNHPNFDMWRFKHGFGGKHVLFLPVYGKVIQPLRGRIFQYLKYRKWA